jgi:hypothetical protein
VSYPNPESVRIHYKTGSSTATLFTAIDGKNRYESLTQDQLTWLLQDISEALRKINKRGAKTAANLRAAIHLESAAIAPQTTELIEAARAAAEELERR